MKYDAVIVASGSGTRAKLGYNKVFFRMRNGKTVLYNAAHLFLEDEDCVKVVLVSDREEDLFKEKKTVFVKGGAQRYDSVRNGLRECTSEYVLIHDGARPFLTKEDLEALKDSTEKYGAALLGMKEINTVKYVEDGIVKRTLVRDNVYAAATPQGFDRKQLLQAYENARLEGITDDASVAENAGMEVHMVSCSPSNIKLTKKEDFENI